MTGWRKIDEVPFDFERRRVSVLVTDGAQRLLVVKGAPEDVPRQSTHYEGEGGVETPLDPAARAELDALFQALGADGFRVLAIASKAMGPEHTSAALGDESELAFAGYAVFLDPPKASAMAAIHDLTRAGVDVRILTGDNERVMRHVCTELGLTVTGLITGDDLRAMSEEAGVPLDHVEAEALAGPVQWDLRLIQRFMLVLGPVSSLFDFLTFYALLHLFNADEAFFQTGWFVESLSTQVLVIFVIRTRRSPWRSRPHPVLAGLTVGVAAIGALLPLTPLGAFFGFVAPPLSFYLFLAAAVVTYLVLVEIAKRLFYRYVAPHQKKRPRRPAHAGT